MKKQSKQNLALVALCIVVGALMGYLNAVTDLPETPVIVGGAIVVAMAIVSVHARKGVLVGGILLYCVTGAAVNVLMTR